MNIVGPEGSGHGQLRLCDTAYADNRTALTLAYAAGLPATARIRSSAPALIDDPQLKVEQSDAHMTSRRIWALDAAFGDMQRDCIGRFGDRNIALIAGRYITLEFQAVAGKAATVSTADLDKPTAVIQLISSDPDLDRMIRSPLVDLLAGNPGLAVFSVPIESLSGRDDPRAPAPTLMQRIRFTGYQTLLYRLIEKLATRFELNGPRGKILILRENELCKETAWNMVLRGYLPRTVPLFRAAADAGQGLISQDETARIQADCRHLVQTHMVPHMLTDRVGTALTSLFETALRERTIRYRASIPQWRQRLSGTLKRGRSAVLTNWVNHPELIGLRTILEECSTPLVLFQHGVTNEINWRMRRYESQYGNSVADLEIMFNDRGAALSMHNPFRRGRAVGTGLPADYYRGMKRGRLGKEVPPIWYICTAFYVANHGQLEGVTDWDKCRHERGIIENVLARLRSKVLFKPYPGRRFEDKDPIETAAENADNITVYRGRLDLRYIVGDARLLISARSFSTPSWCLSTGLPLVHIDIPDQDPLDAEARAAFRDGVFLFDASAPDFHERLRDFLDRPIEEIDREWRAKAPARADLMRTFVSNVDTGGGRRAADQVVREIRSMAGSA